MALRDTSSKVNPFLQMAYLVYASLRFHDPLCARRWNGSGRRCGRRCGPHGPHFIASSISGGNPGMSW